LTPALPAAIPEGRTAGPGWGAPPGRSPGGWHTCRHAEAAGATHAAARRLPARSARVCGESGCCKRRDASMRRDSGRNAQRSDQPADDRVGSRGARARWWRRDRSRIRRLIGFWPKPPACPCGAAWWKRTTMSAGDEDAARAAGRGGAAARLLPARKVAHRFAGDANRRAAAGVGERSSSRRPKRGAAVAARTVAFLFACACNGRDARQDRARGVREARADRRGGEARRSGCPHCSPGTTARPLQTM